MDIEINATSAKSYLGEVAEKLDDMTSIMGLIGEIVQSSVERNFEVGGRYKEPGSYDGGPNKWVDLAEGTKKARARRGHWPGPILQDTGRLAASFHYNAHEDSVEVGTNVEYAAIHEFGGTIQRTSKKGKGYSIRIPARPFLVVQDEDLDEIVSAVKDFLDQ